MFNSVALEVVIGLVFVYLLYSLLTTIIMEIIATWFSFRAKTLKHAITRMLDDGSGSRILSDLFYDHPLIKYLGEDSKKSKPAYINNGTFSKVFVDFLRTDAIRLGEDAGAFIHQTLETGKIAWNGTTITINADTLKYLNSIWIDAQGDVSRFREKLENWFDETMERSSGWYKRNAQVWLFGIGFVIAIVFNVDTISIVSKLEKDPKLREQLVQQADAYVKAHPNLDKELAQHKEENNKEVEQKYTAATTQKDSLALQRELQLQDSLAEVTYKKNKHLRDSLITYADSLVKADLKKVNGVLGMGLSSFECKPCFWRCLPKAIMGWAITALALSLGAPFWFDMLNKLMKLRSSVSSNSSDPQVAKEQKKQKGTPDPKG